MRMDCDEAKLFVGGISFETTQDTLKDHFTKYGEVVETVIMKDRVSGNARGFGFVLFSDPSAADKALQDKHAILSRTVEVKKALPRGGKQHRYQQSKGFSKKNYSFQFRTKKIFVGGLPASVTEEEFKAYFERFGRITDVVVMYDNVTRRARGFGFITFDSEEAVENVMQQTFHVLNNKSVEVKRAVPKDGTGTSSNSGNYNNYSNTFDSGVGAGGGSIFGKYNGGMYPPFGPGYNVFPGYAPPLMSGYPYGAYPIGGYGGLGFGPSPMAVPRGPWNGPGMVGVRQSPVPYGSAPVHPGYMNDIVGGFMGMIAGDYNGITGTATNGKLNQDSSCDTQLAAGVSRLKLDGGKSDDESSVNIRNHGDVVSKPNQSQR